MFRVPAWLAASLEVWCDKANVPPTTKVAAAWAVLLARFVDQSIVTVEIRPSDGPGDAFLFRVELANGATILDVLTRLRQVSADRCDLSLKLCERDGPWIGQVECHHEAIGSAALDSMLDCLAPLLEGIIEDVERPVADLPLVSERTRRKVLHDWNATCADYPRAACVHELVAAQVGKTPETVAVVAEDRRLTYRELNCRAEQLAARLQAADVAPGSLVGVCLPRSLEALVALLGILKTGAAYVPLDPTYPRKRLEGMLDDAAVDVVLCDAASEPLLAGRDVQVLRAEDDGRSSSAAADPPAARVGPDRLAYVMYTSGSTGRPKGVAMPHRALVNLLTWQRSGGLDPRAARTLQFASLSFDVSFQEIFSTWCTGGTLVLVDEATRRDRKALLRLLEEQAIERAFLPVVALQFLAEAAVGEQRFPARLREIITAGEQLEITAPVRGLLRRLPACTLHNHYGPSETHVVTAHTLTGSPEAFPALPPIGRPIANVQTYVLDAQQQPVPVGVVGELYIGGDALAREYLNQPERTTERFVSGPFRPGVGHRLYRTGDMVRWLASGELEFMGRRDEQVKIRGHRVELGEIAVTLEQHPAVEKAVALAEDDRHGGKRLVAGAVRRSGRELTAGDLQQWLKGQLIESMRPSKIVVLDSLPLSPNGKVDRGAILLSARNAATTSGSMIAPRDAVELFLVQMWEELVDRRPVGVEDDFFDLGGNSVMAMEVAARIETRYGLEFPASRLLEHPSVGQLARYVAERGEAAEFSPIVPLQPCGDGRPVFCVHPAGGNALCYLRLSQHLGKGHPLFGLQAAGIDGSRPPTTSVEAMAADYVAAIRQIQPRGPYLIGGWSLGGTLAFEMARQLHAEGEHVERLLVIDTGVMYSLAVMLTLFPTDEAGLLGLAGRSQAERLAAFREQTANAQLVPPGASDSQAWRIAQVFQANLRALVNYRPRPYAGRLTLFLGREPLVETRYDPVREWGELCDTVDLHMVPGNHLTLLAEPHVAELAKAIRGCLEETRPATDARVAV